MPAVPGTPPWPSLELVAAVLRARTKDNEGVELGTWTDDTRPTDDQVIEMMSLAALDLFPCTGVFDDLEEIFWEPVSALIALYTAAMAELSHRPEQVNADRAVYDELMELYNRGREQVCAAIEEVRAGGTVGGPDTTGLARGSFPAYDWVWVGPGVRTRTAAEYYLDILAGRES
jgi:hypothetical protein